jgi:hypothetical protein
MRIFSYIFAIIFLYSFASTRFEQRTGALSKEKTLSKSKKKRPVVS